MLRKLACLAYFVLLLAVVDSVSAVGQATNPYPPNGAMYGDTWVTLSWKPGKFAVSYNVYLGENFDDVNNGAGVTFRGNQTATSFVVGFPGFPYPDGLVPGTTYYWRIDEVDEGAQLQSITRGDIWSFTITPKKAYNPNPADRATVNGPDVELSWTAGMGAKLHTVYFGDNLDEVSNAVRGPSQGVTTHIVRGLEPGVTYYWRVDEFDGFTTYKGDIWRFTTTEAPQPPRPPINPSPRDRATDQPIDVDISWENGGGATGYSVYFGTDPTPDSGEYKVSQTATRYDPGTLNYSTTYYWRIDATNSSGTTTGPVWSFTTTQAPPPPRPFKPINPSPRDRATDQPIDVDISWENGGGATGYSVYFGTDPTPDSDEYKVSQTGTRYDPGTLNYSTTYYWRIDATNSSGTTTGDVWSFITVQQPPPTAYEPDPPNNAIDVDPNVTLRWSAGFGAILHHVYFGANSAAVEMGVRGTDKGTTSATSFVPGPLERGITYYWRVDEFDGRVNHKGDVWRFTVQQPPPTAYEPDPPNNAIDVDPNVTLRWSAGFGAILHHVYFGANSAAVEMGVRGTDKGTTSATSFVPGPLERGITYYWRVDEFDGRVNHKGDVWRFTVLDGLPRQTAHNPYPADDAIRQTTWANLSWTAGGFATSYNVYFGDNLEDVSAGVNDAFQGYQTSTHFVVGFPGFPFPEGLGPDTTYYWRIDTVQADGTTFTGEVWSFTVLPARAHDSDPADSAKLVDQNVILSWTAGFDAKLHTVYFGDDFDDVNNATGADQQEDTIYNPSFLEPNMTYYWRVDEFDGVATHKGDIWTFTTAQPSLTEVDHFDHYSTGYGTRIIDFWADGGGWPSRPAAEAPSIPSNETGAIVGHDIWTSGSPYTTLMETTIVYSGTQSMPLYYNNTKPPFYSQVDRTFSKPVDWTVNGANAFTLYLHGQAPKLRETPTGGFVLSGAGKDIWGTSDEFRFLYKLLIGNGQITARVVDMGQGSDAWAKGGVMIRESLEAGSPHAMMVLTGGAGGGAAFQWRPFVSSDSWSARNPTPAESPPYWVRIERKGNALKGYLSPDGVNWTQQGQTETIDMWGAAVFIGLCVTSNVSGELRIVEFDSIDTTGAVLGQWEIEDVGVEQPGNEPAPLYIKVEDTTGNVAVVNHPDPKATVTTYWQRWTIPFSDLKNAGVDLRAVKKVSIGVGGSDYRARARFAPLALNPQDYGVVYCDGLGAGTAGASLGTMEGFIWDILTGQAVPNAQDPDVTLYPYNGTGEISDDIWYDDTYPDGYYWVELPLAKHTIVVEAGGFQPASPNVRLLADETKRDFLLTPGSTSLGRPVYCFQLSDSRYFYYAVDNYTSKTDERLSERDELLSDPDNWTYAGVAFCAWEDDTSDTRLMPVYRLWVEKTGAPSIPFYTINETEKDQKLIDHADVYSYEGIAFYAYKEDPKIPEYKKVYRLKYVSSEDYIYTISEDMKDQLEASGNWTYESVAWYAFDCAGL